MHIYLPVWKIRFLEVGLSDHSGFTVLKKISNCHLKRIILIYFPQQIISDEGRRKK